MTQKKTLAKVAFVAMLCCSNMVLAMDRVDRDEDRLERETAQNTPRHQETLQNEVRVSYQDFMRMDDQQIQTVRTVIVPLSESYFNIFDSMKRNAFNRKLEQNHDIMLVLDCAGARHIGDDCLYSVNANHVKIIHAENVTDIGNAFLSGCTGLTMLDLRPLSNVRSIGDFFITGCTGLTTLDLSSLSNVTDIGNGFLGGSTGLTTLDLRPLSNVRSIGNWFLSRCLGLTTLNLSPLSNVRSIGNSFLFKCTGLRTLDLRPLSNVTHIGDEFLRFCTGLARDRVTMPENWRFENRLPQHLRAVQNDRSRSLNPQPYINQLRERNIDPKRDGSDYTEIEFNIASVFLQGAEQSQNGYLSRLEQVFSTQRAVKLLEDIYNGDNHSSDSENSDH